MNRLREKFAFVVIGRNEGERLHKCLQSIMKVSHRVVYADSASTDGSVALAKSMGIRVVELDSSMPLNAARGRNAGLEMVRRSFPQCRYVQFIDGDCTLVDDWVDHALRFLDQRPRVAVACGRRFEAKPDASIYNHLANDEWNTRIGPAEECGGDAMMRLRALEEVGAFNPTLMASEEPELSARLRARGWEIWRLDAPMTEHDAAMFHFQQWWRRCLRAGYGNTQAWQATRNLPQRVNAGRLRSAFFWVVLVPMAALILAIVMQRTILLVAIPLIYTIQIIRMSGRSSQLSMYAIRRSAMMMLGKVPELIGAARFLLSAKRPETIDYKNTPLSTSASQ